MSFLYRLFNYLLYIFSLGAYPFRSQPTQPFITGVTYMLGTLKIGYSFDGMDVFGQDEVIEGARIFINDFEIEEEVLFTKTTDTLGEVMVENLSLPLGMNELEMAFIDDEGTTGKRSSFMVEVTDAGPTAPVLTSVQFVQEGSEMEGEEESPEEPAATL